MKLVRLHQHTMMPGWSHLWTTPQVKKNRDQPNYFAFLLNHSKYLEDRVFSSDYASDLKKLFQQIKENLLIRTGIWKENPLTRTFFTQHGMISPWNRTLLRWRVALCWAAPIQTWSISTLFGTRVMYSVTYSNLFMKWGIQSFCTYGRIEAMDQEPKSADHDPQRLQDSEKNPIECVLR